MSNDILNLTAEPKDEGKRLDVFICENVEQLTRNRAQQLIAEGCVFCNKKQVTKSCKLQNGNEISVTIPQVKPVEIISQDIPLCIVYEDNDILIINKPKGMVVHPAAGNPDGTLVNALLHHCGDSLSGINGEHRPGIVHRIDKDTSGLLVVAKNDFAHTNLSSQLATHSIKREYHAVVYGNLKQDIGVVDAPIGRNPADRKKMAINYKNGKHAVTHFEVIERFNGFSYIKCNLETGRTHQIRVHMASLGHPIAGDIIYGPHKAITELGGQCLHAKVLSFTHPRTNELVQFETDLPEYFKKFLDKLKRKM